MTACATCTSSPVDFICFEALRRNANTIKPGRNQRKDIVTIAARYDASLGLRALVDQCDVDRWNDRVRLISDLARDAAGRYLRSHQPGSEQTNSREQLPPCGNLQSAALLISPILRELGRFYNSSVISLPPLMVARSARPLCRNVSRM